MKRLTTVLVVVGLVTALFALAAAAHIPGTTRHEAGILDCGNPAPQPATTHIYADAHHRHKVGSTDVYVHYAWNGTKLPSSVYWEVVLADYGLYNTTGASFSTSSSWAGCT